MNKRHILILILILGFLLRIWQIFRIPPGVNRDEASIGFAAYSLLKTGKDEHGVSWPVSFKSFGDWKLPFYIYADIPFVKIYGLTDISTRLPSVLFGTLTIIVTYFLARELFKDIISRSKWYSKIPLLSAFLFAVSPWSIHLSRTASEANVAVFFTSLGILLYLRGVFNRWILLPAAIFLALSLYIYHADHIFIPLLLIVLFAIFFRKYKSSAFYWISAVIFVILALFIFSQTLFIADKTKISGLFAATDPVLVYTDVTTDRLEHGQTPRIIVNLLHNKVVFTAISAFQSYIKSFSPEFLFISGGGNEQHNIPDFGNLYLWEAPFLLLGLSFILISKYEKKSLVLLWLLIAPIASSITKDAPHTARMTVIMPLLDIITAYGFLGLIRGTTVKRRIISIPAVSLLVVLFILNFAVWNDRYFVHFPMKRAAAWGEGYQKLVVFLRVNNNFKVKEVVMSRPEYSPYIYFLFYNSIDPGYFQKSVVWYPQTSEGFQHVAKLGDYSFRQIDWSDDLAIPDKLYIDWSSQMPSSATQSATLITEELMDKLIKNKKDVSSIKIGDYVISKKMGEIKLQNNESLFTVIKTEKYN